MDIPESLFEAAEGYSDAILALPGVTGWDVGIAESGDDLTEDYAIRIYIADLSQVVDGQIPPDYDGYPTNLLEASFELDDDTTRYDPLIAGCEIENGEADQILGSSGTFGVVVRDIERSTLCGLTNAHVLCRGNYHIGNVISQPARTSASPPPANTIGVLTRWNFDHDCAIFEIRGSLTATLDILEIGSIAGSRSLPDLDPYNPPRVRKRGKHTGLTFGRVVAKQRLATTDPDGLAVPPHFTVRIDSGSTPPYSGSGDSGSAVVDDGNFVVGLHFARSDPIGKYGLAIPWDDVAGCLPIEVAT